MILIISLFMNKFNTINVKAAKCTIYMQLAFKATDQVFDLITKSQEKEQHKKLKISQKHINMCMRVYQM